MSGLPPPPRRPLPSDGSNPYASRPANGHARTPMMPQGATPQKDIFSQVGIAAAEPGGASSAAGGQAGRPKQSLRDMLKTMAPAAAGPIGGPVPSTSLPPGGLDLPAAPAMPQRRPLPPRGVMMMQQPSSDGSPAPEGSPPPPTPQRAALEATESAAAPTPLAPRFSPPLQRPDADEATASSETTADSELQSPQRRSSRPLPSQGAFGRPSESGAAAQPDEFVPLSQPMSKEERRAMAMGIANIDPQALSTPLGHQLFNGPTGGRTPMTQQRPGQRLTADEPHSPVRTSHDQHSTPETPQQLVRAAPPVIVPSPAPTVPTFQELLPATPQRPDGAGPIVVSTPAQVTSTSELSPQSQQHIEKEQRRTENLEEAFHQLSVKMNVVLENLVRKFEPRNDGKRVMQEQLLKVIQDQVAITEKFAQECGKRLKSKDSKLRRLAGDNAALKQKLKAAELALADAPSAPPQAQAGPSDETVRELAEARRQVGAVQQEMQRLQSESQRLKAAAAQAEERARQAEQEAAAAKTKAANASVAAPSTPAVRIVQSGRGRCWSLGWLVLMVLLLASGTILVSQVQLMRSPEDTPVSATIAVYAARLFGSQSASSSEFSHSSSTESATEFTTGADGVFTSCSAWQTRLDSCEASSERCVKNQQTTSQRAEQCLTMLKSVQEECLQAVTKINQSKADTPAGRFLTLQHDFVSLEERLARAKADSDAALDSVEHGVNQMLAKCNADYRFNAIRAGEESSWAKTMSLLGYILADLLVFHAIHPRGSRLFSLLVMLLWAAGGVYFFAGQQMIACGLCTANAILAFCLVLVPSLSRGVSLSASFS